MEPGYLVGGRDAVRLVRRRPGGLRLMDPEDTLYLQGDGTFWCDYKIAWTCKACRKLVLDLPEEANEDAPQAAYEEELRRYADQANMREEEDGPMAQLYFKYGAMGSSKTANALMTRFNYEERGQKTLLVKPRIDTRDGDHMVVSRIGLTYPCIYFDELRALSVMELQQNACVIVDEAQFLTREEVMYLVGLVDDLGIPVICYGLRADFKGDLFPGSEALLVMADKLEEVKTVCWCGRKATFNARFDRSGKVLKEGEQVVLGANDQYIGLCRRHWMAGDLGPDFDVDRL